MSKDKVKRCNQIWLLLSKFDSRKDKGEILNKLFKEKKNKKIKIKNKKKPIKKTSNLEGIKKKNNSVNKVIVKDNGYIYKKKSDQKKIELKVDNN